MNKDEARNRVRNLTMSMRKEDAIDMLDAADTYAQAAISEADSIVLLEELARRYGICALPRWDAGARQEWTLRVIFHNDAEPWLAYWVDGPKSGYLKREEAIALLAPEGK